MACAYYLKWYNQSQNHSYLGDSNYPFMSDAAMVSGDYNQYQEEIASLSPANKAAAEAEWASWWHDYGYNWDKLNCPLESNPGESNQNVTDIVKDTSVLNIQKRLKALGYNPGTLDGKFGPSTCKACYAQKKAQVDYTQTLSAIFFRDLGFDAGKATDLAKQYGNVCVPYFVPLSADSQKNDIMSIQGRLIKLGYTGVTVNGIWDVQTCSALNSFQIKTFNDMSFIIKKQTFVAMGFETAYAELYEQQFSNSCKSFFVTTPAEPEITTKSKTCSGGKVISWQSNQAEPACPSAPTPTITTKSKICSNGSKITWKSNQREPACPKAETPEIKKAGFGGWVALLGAVLVGGVMLFSKKRKKGGK